MSNSPSATPRWFIDAIETPFEERFVDVAGCPIVGDRSRPGIVLVYGGAAYAH